MSALRRFAEAVGRGLAAGVAGTAAMTASSTIEARVRGRGSSDAPAKAAGKVLGVQPRDPRGRARFARIVHWSYGTSWGAVRGLLGELGLPPALATAAHFGVVWGAELAVLPALRVAPPASEWGQTELAVDAGHHVVYATATGVAYQALMRA
jgi:hypothetical protein